MRLRDDDDDICLHTEVVKLAHAEVNRVVGCRLHGIKAAVEFFGLADEVNHVTALDLPKGVIVDSVGTVIMRDDQTFSIQIRQRTGETGDVLRIGEMLGAKNSDDERKSRETHDESFCC